MFSVLIESINGTANYLLTVSRSWPDDMLGEKTLVVSAPGFLFQYDSDIAIDQVNN